MTDDNLKPTHINLDCPTCGKRATDTQVSSLVSALQDANGALNAMAAQVDAEWRNHDKAADKNDKIVRAFREKARAALDGIVSKSGE